ncbi:MAG: phosphoglycerate dehydrogenase [Gammaproteobacteria bacterium]|nr:phosphoglycerate dehydrogenase [Gammaproteobacteria bacterium]NNK97631.1 phosphoglycerate dehydrogenase [Xanthomonadales bacterium]
MVNSERSYSLDKEKIKFLLLEGIHPMAREVIENAGYTNITEKKGALTPEALRQALKGVHFVGIRSRTQLDAAALEAADRLTAIGCFCIGTNQVDLQRAERVGTPVFNAPFANTRSVAELSLAEIIMLMRRIPEKNAAAHRGEWLKSASGSTEIRGKTLGIVGYGHIGSQLGIIAESMGMRVIFQDIENKLPLGNAEERPDLDTLLNEADVVSLHVPDTEDTRNLMSAKAIGKMRTGSYLINASRGTVVDIEALSEGLKSGHIAGAAIDVFPREPKSNEDRFESPLLGLDNVLLTPHIGGSTLEAQKNIAVEVASKLVRYSDNGSTRSAVNFPQVSLPDHGDTRRIMHIHHNEPGVLKSINQVFFKHEVNIAAQYLQTDGDIGYVVMDIESEDATGLMQELAKIPATVRTRILH